MLFSNNIWAAYGIRTAPEESFEMQNLNHLAQRATAAEPSLVVDTSTAPTPSTSKPTASSTTTPQTTTTFEPAVPIAPSASPATPSSFRLSPAAIAGLCIGIGVLVVLAGYIALEVCVLRRRRRERALRRAVEEVENGSIRSDSVRSEVKSREEFVVDEKNVHADEEIWSVEEGRKGLSLPRRMW
ncbi:hypothetical protein E8E12_002925 [Didymella heteroderae]|uniref:Uncharacterized protein n=1 Tax=Didymella heteroderae TaxID=1769908 RepID=A0A9P4X1J6_9PLEO|nr:hypothetical protein E8E12_002925 [Didymella heteroderae]